jgi:adenosylcobinamide-GDP ribazoletransferase
MRDAFSYFSILPAGFRGAPRASALAWLPLVGAVVGGIAGGVAQLATIVFGHPIGVALAFGLSIALTGALHVDGFLDASDALGASVSPERRREILKDPRHGTFAVANFAVAAALWLGALAALDPGKLAIGTAAAAAAARWCIVWLAYAQPYGDAGAEPGAGTLAGALRARPPWPVTALMTLLVFGLALAYAPWAGLAPLTGLVVLLGAPSARRRLGGVLGGDMYGAGIVVAEIVVLLALGALGRIG